MRCWGGENTSKAQSSQAWRVTPAPCLHSCNAVGLAEQLEEARAGTSLPQGRSHTPRHCLFPELLRCSVWMERLVGRGPPATSVFLFCAQQCLISSAHAERYDSEGARLASASCACRQGGCAMIPLCFKTLCQHSKSKS